MNERNGHQSAAQRLRRARRSCGQPTPERLEENLRWLMHLTLPPVRASERLRQRVRAMAEAHRAWLESEQMSRQALRDWPGVDAALAERERETLALLLTADLPLLAADPVVCEEARQVMRHLLAALPEPLREALLLQVIQGLSLTEIAQVLGCPESETAALLSQARSTIFRQVESSTEGAAGN
jgi:DNA-directed RNA polymerase specialized sigma24 family protein